MKLIIAGCRDVPYRDAWDLIVKGVSELPFCSEITEIVHGGCRGVDEVASEALRCKYNETCFPADWNKYGRSAGPIRNREMAKYGDALLAIWDRKSRGTKNMIDEAIKVGIPVHIVEWNCK